MSSTSLSCVRSRPPACLRRLVFGVRDVEVAVGVVPGGDAMAPPQLARHAPVLDVFQPLAVGGGPVFRHEFQLAGIDRVQALFGEAFHAHEPLVGEHRLDHRVGAVAARDHQLVRLGRDQQAFCLQFVEQLLPRVVAVQPLVFGRAEVVHFGVERQHADRHQLVALADLPVVEVVRRGDLDHAGAEFAVDIVVGDDGDAALGDRQAHVLADQVLRSARPPDAPRRRCRRAGFPGGWWRRSESRSRLPADS